MRGMGEAKRLTVARFKARLPAVLEVLAVAEGRPAGTVDLPRLYAAHEVPQLALDEWPAVVVVGQDASDLRPVDVEDVDGRYADVWEVTYGLRVFTFARADTYDAVDADRDRLVLGVREVLLEQPAVGDATTGARVDPTSIRESYSDVMPDELGRSVAAAFLEVNVTLTEVISRARLATVTAADPTGHPAL